MHDPGEELVNCPYNKAHALLKSRMQFHLTKCRQNYPNAEKVHCPYNSTHMVNEIELEHHSENCPDRGVVDNYVFRMADNPPPPGILPVQTFSVCSNDDEFWDDPSENQPSVLTQVANLAKTKGVLIPVIGAPKAERKNHRFKERLRHAAIANESENLKHAGPAPASIRAASKTPQASPKAQEPKRVDMAPPPQVPEPEFVLPQSSGSPSSAAPPSIWSRGKPAPQVSDPHDFPTLGSKPAVTRRDNDVGLQDKMNNMTLLDSDRNEKPKVWGRPAPRQQDARIAVPAGGCAGGSNRPHSNPWGRSGQQQSAQPVQASDAPTEARQPSTMPAITSDDFPVLGRGRKIRN